MAKTPNSGYRNQQGKDEGEYRPETPQQPRTPKEREQDYDKSSHGTSEDGA